MAKQAAKKKAAKKKTGRSVAKRKQDALVGGIDPLAFVTEHAGAGSEEVTREEMALPFLGLLQALSPQVAKREDAYIEDAEPGMFFDTVRQTLWDGEEGMLVIPCHMSPVVVEWVNREAGGGFVAVHPNMKAARKACQDPENHDLVQTHQHAVLVQNPDKTWSEAIWPMKSTALTPSRQWNSRIAMQERTFLNTDTGEEETRRNLPRFYSVWRVTSAERTNDKGRFFVPKISGEPEVDLFDLGDDGVALLQRAAAFRELCASGAAAVDYRRMADMDDADEEEEDGEAPGF